MKYPDHITPRPCGWLRNDEVVLLSDVGPEWLDVELSTTYYKAWEDEDRAFYVGRYGQRMYLK